MRIFIFTAFFAATLFVIAAGDVKAAATPEEIRQICQKAEKRYEKIHGAKPAAPDVVVVKMYKYTFCPGSVTVKQGTTVRWINVDKRTSHSVWFRKKGDEETTRLFSEEMVEMKFDLPAGDYPYLCGPHWQSDGMLGTVTVVE